MAILKALPGSAKVNGKPIKGNQSIKGKLISVKKSVINIGKFLDKSHGITKKQNEEFRKRDQNFNRKQREEKLEEPKKEWKKLVPKKIPGLSFFDSIKKFVAGWILGFIAIKLIPLLPKLIPIVINLGRFVNFVIDIGGKFLSGFISFIDFGVKAGEATFGFLKNIGGEDFAKSFARFGGLLGTVLDLMLVIGGMTLMERLSGDEGGGLFDLFGRKSTKTAAKTGVKSAGRSAITKLGRNALVKTLGKSGSKQFLKLTKNFISPIVKKIPLIGALADFALNVFVFGESPGRAAFKAIGAGLGIWALGALGSFIPGLGTLIGATVGGIAGDVLGGLIYDMVFENKDNSKKKAYEKDEKENSRRRAVIATGATLTAGTAAYKSLNKQTTKKVVQESVEAGTKKVVREGGEKVLKSGTKKVLKSATKASLKSSKNLISPIVKKIPFIGALVDFALNYFVFKEPLGKSAFMAIGAGVGAWLGGILGTLIPVPFVGTTIGAFVGGVGGDKLAGALYGAIFEKKEPKEDKKDDKRKKTTTVSISKNRESYVSMLKSGERSKIEQALYNMRLNAKQGGGGFNDFVGNPKYEGDVNLIMKHGLGKVEIDGGRVSLQGNVVINPKETNTIIKGNKENIVPLDVNGVSKKADNISMNTSYQEGGDETVVVPSRSQTSNNGETSSSSKNLVTVSAGSVGGDDDMSDALYMGG